MASKLHTSFGDEQHIFLTIAHMEELIGEGIPILRNLAREGFCHLAEDLYLKKVSNPPERRDS